MAMSVGPIPHLDRDDGWRRAISTAIGAVGGACAWILSDPAPALIANDRLILFLAAFGAGLFLPWLVLAGATRFARAGLAALAIAVPLAALITWASLRFDRVEDFLNTGHPLAAAALLIAVPVPYLAVATSGGGVLDHARLFPAAWTAALRLLAAALFLGTFWVVLGLSGQLLSLVGIDLIERLIDLGPAPLTLSGAAVGLGLAVAAELAGQISPQLPLRLLGLLLPVLLAVTVLFLLALPVRGLSDLFGDWSAAGILIAMAMAGIILIAVVLGPVGAGTVSPGLNWSSRAMAVIVGVLSGLALWAVVLRVAQYGWTPDRLAAATAAGWVVFLGLAHAVAALSGRRWADLVRRADAVMPLLAVLVAALWLTPLLNPQRIATRDQIARLETGRTDPEDLDLWTIGRDWGRAGARAVERLAASDSPAMAPLRERIAVLKTASDRWSFAAESRPRTTSVQVDTLRQRMPVLPPGKTVPADLLLAPNLARSQPLIDACGRKTPGGRPGCLALVADLVSDSEGDETVILSLEGDFTLVEVFGRRDGQLVRLETRWVGGETAPFDANLIDRTAEAGLQMTPVPLTALDLAGSRLLVLP